MSFVKACSILHDYKILPKVILLCEKFYKSKKKQWVCDKCDEKTTSIWSDLPPSTSLEGNIILATMNMLKEGLLSKLNSEISNILDSQTKELKTMNSSFTTIEKSTKRRILGVSSWSRPTRRWAAGWATCDSKYKI